MENLSQVQPEPPLPPSAIKWENVGTRKNMETLSFQERDRALKVFQYVQSNKKKLSLENPEKAASLKERVEGHLTEIKKKTRGLFNLNDLKQKYLHS